MRRPLALPAALGFLACSATAAAFVLGGDPVAVSRAVAVTTSTTAPPPVPTTTNPVVPPASPSGMGAVLASLEGVWAQTRQPEASCLVVLNGDGLVFERNGDVAVTPASTMKLLTATAVLAQLDPEERLRTRVLARRPATDGVVDGDLYLVGGGDPVLGTDEWAAHFRRQPRLYTSMDSLADRIVGAGVREVRGRVVGDEQRYDSERYVTSWPQRYLDDNQTGRLSALFLNDGFAVWDRRDEDDVPWADPPRDAAAVLTSMLRGRGVVVGADAAAGSVAPNAVELAAVESPTIGRLVEAMLQDSDNGTSELLVKELGVRKRGIGSTAVGVTVVAETLERLGLPMAGVVVHDGSGLDRSNQVTCRLLAGVLRRPAALTGPIGTGLPVAAHTGTLEKRFLASPAAGHLRAKTGSIRGVASLAGYADASVGTLTFAHVLNGIGTYEDGIRVQEALGATLVGL